MLKTDKLDPTSSVQRMLIPKNCPIAWSGHRNLNYGPGIIGPKAVPWLDPFGFQSYLGKIVPLTSLVYDYDHIYTIFDWTVCSSLFEWRFSSFDPPCKGFVVFASGAFSAIMAWQRPTLLRKHQVFFPSLGLCYRHHNSGLVSLIEWNLGKDYSTLSLLHSWITSSAWEESSKGRILVFLIFDFCF